MFVNLFPDIDCKTMSNWYYFTVFSCDYIVL